MPRPSGRFVVRVPPTLHGRLRELAAGSGVSLNTLCVQLLSAGAEGHVAPAEHSPWSWIARRYEEVFGHEPVAVVLFGSAARGELRGDSDVDLLVVLDPGVPLRRALYRQWDELVSQGTFERAINAHFVHLPARVEDAGSLWLEVAVEGRVLSDRDDTVRRFLVAVRGAIASGRFVRSVLHGQPYWRRAA